MKRINEYCPYDMPKYGKGEGNQYVDFVVNDTEAFYRQADPERSKNKEAYVYRREFDGRVDLNVCRLEIPEGLWWRGRFFTRVLDRSPDLSVT